MVPFCLVSPPTDGCGWRRQKGTDEWRWLGFEEEKEEKMSREWAVARADTAPLSIASEELSMTGVPR
jgi:hypothetical protein